MKTNSIIICLLLCVLSSCKTAKFASTGSVLHSKEEYFAYNIKPDGDIGDVNIASIFSRKYKRDSLPLTFSVETKNDSLFLWYKIAKDSSLVTIKEAYKGTKKQKFWRKYFSFVVIPFFPIFAKTNIDRIRIGKDREGNLLVQNYYDNSGWILIIGAGRSGHPEYVFKNPNKVNRTTSYYEKGLFGLKNAHQEKITPPLFQYISAFNNQLAEVKYQNLWGIINEKGQWIIPAQYHSLRTSEVYDEPTVYVVSIGEKYGIISRSGTELVPLQYDEITNNNSNRYILTKGTKKGLFIGGKIHIPAIYTQFYGLLIDGKYQLCFKEDVPFFVDDAGYEYAALKREKSTHLISLPSYQTSEIEYNKVFYRPNLLKKRKIALEEESN